MSTEQRSLFGHQPAPWDEDADSERLVARVVVLDGPPQPLDYLVPAPLQDEVEPGRRVKVPLGRGNRRVTAYCVEVGYKPVRRQLKEVQSVVDGRSLLTPAMLGLTEWISERYLCDWAQVLEAVVPAGVRWQAGTRVTTLLTPAAGVNLRVSKLKLPPKQEAALQKLIAAGKPLAPQQLAKMAGCTQAPIQALREKGLVEASTERRSQFAPLENEAKRRDDLQLNPQQQGALEAITTALSQRRHETILLHGVTGSGKTEVYIQAIQEVIQYGRQAIVLVPEISLTPQTHQRFRERFDHVALLHSHLTDSERHHHWQRIADGRVQVVVGARSAIFAPLPHLGLVVIDEEHESSFKQETAPRYHARDVAAERARREGIPLVLGSATPSLESWQRAKTGDYRLVPLPKRVLDLPMPVVRTIDLRATGQDRKTRGVISRPLRLQMEATLRDGGQIILLLNRRGFSTHIQCPSCGLVLQCPSCDIALTHHLQEQVAICHYCDYRRPAPMKCPECNFAGIRYAGVGTQRLESEVRSLFPGVTAMRMDTDAMQRLGSYEAALAAFRNGDVQILLGTQMIAKGLDFPNVTLVGVINADTALHLPDFRASERTFHLLVQVAGRTGRGDRGGQVLVQTFSPDHPAIQAAIQHDYRRFAGLELPLRSGLGYPPFGSMVRMVIRGPVAEVTEEFSGHIASLLREQLAGHAHEAASKTRVLGPAPAPLAKLRDRYRFQIHAHGPDGDVLREVFRRATADLKPPEDVQWIIDIDPVNML